MRLRVLLLACVLVVAAACQPTPVTVVLVVTATPDDAATLTPSTTPPPSETASADATVTLSPSIPAATPTFAPTATLDLFPTPTVGQVQVAEQLFQRGRMFWVQPTGQIWVLVLNGEGRGTWTIYPDNFDETVDPDIDPALTPPDGLIQPERGFGKLWRTNQDVRDALGWATTPEFGYVSRYEYHPGGTVADGQYQVAPGYHILYSLYQEQFRFNEVDGTWQLGGG